MKPSFKQKFSYFFDNTLSRGTGAIIALLSIFTLLAVLVFALIYILIGIPFSETEKFTFFEAMWQSLMRSLDSGTVAGDTSWVLRGVGILVTISGIFILSTLIGILSQGLGEKIDELKKGRSIVLAENHTLIIGWSQKIFFIIEELIIANGNQKKPTIVILSNRDKVEMDEEIRNRIEDSKNTKIITRSGDTLDVNSIKTVNPDGAKSIIILAPDDADENSKDIQVIKTVLALVYNTKRENKEYNIVAEINNFENLDAAEVVGKTEATFLYTKDIVSRITAQTSHQPGLSIIYMGLLCFEGDEIYFSKIDALIGKTYKQAISAFETSSVFGIKKSDGEILINPEMNTKIEAGDEIISISEDDDTVILSGKTDIIINDTAIIKTERKTSVQKEKNIILGWNDGALSLVKELDEYVDKNSKLTIVLLSDLNDDLKDLVNNSIKNQTVDFIEMDYTKRVNLIKLDIISYDNIVILSNNSLDPQEADSYTLLSLVLIRNIAEENGKVIKIISEMNDQKNRELAEVTEADDFIIGQDLVSRILAQISENREIKNVYDNLFSAAGSEIYLKDAVDYVNFGEPVDFYTIIESASLKTETAIGYRIVEHSHNSEKGYGIKINPKKSDKITFRKGDKIIVLSED